jgi:hypothetical protein
MDMLVVYCHPIEHMLLLLFFVFAFKIWCYNDTAFELSEYSLYDRLLDFLLYFNGHCTYFVPEHNSVMQMILTEI